MAAPLARARPLADPFFRAIVGVALLLALMHSVLLPLWRAGPVLVVFPWFVPITSTFLAVTALCASALALGRYQVLGMPSAAWIGLAFATYSITLGFYVLSWPGLLPTSRALLGHSPNTSAVFGTLAEAVLGLGLLGAAVPPLTGACSARSSRWGWGLVAWLALVILLGGLLLALEPQLPILVGDDGHYTPLFQGVNLVLTVLFLVGAISSARGYLRTGDRLLASLIVCQLTYASFLLTALGGGQRYDLWWYVSRLILVGGFLVGLAGFLAEYVQLLRREQAQARALEARTAELEAVLDAVPAVVWIAHDPDAEVITGNRAAYELLRMGPAQNLSKSAHPEEAPTHFQVYQRGVALAPEALPVQRAARGEAIRDFEEEIVFGDGTSATLLGNATPLYAENGRVRGAVAAFLDITVRQRAETALRQLQQVTAALVEALTPEQVGAVLVQHTMAALGAQSAALALRSDDGAQLTLVHTAGDPAVGRAAWQQTLVGANTPLTDCLQSGQALYLESPVALAARYPGLERLGAALGAGAWVAMPLRASGQTCGGLGVTFAAARAFSAEERAFLATLAQQGAAALERARLYAGEHHARTAAEAAVRQREEFLSIAAHELKTPLAALLGSAQLLHMRAQQSDLLSARDRAGLERVWAQGQRLERMVTRLLDLGRITQGRLQLDLDAVDLTALVQRTVAEVQPGSSRHQFVVMGGAAPVWLHGDELRLTQVLHNLLENAVKYSPHGGTITVTLTAQAQTVQVTVTDEGIGIPAADLPHLWRRFYRAGNVDVDHISGVGIGLYVVHEIVTLHGGQVTVASVEGQGSTFTITLPRTAGADHLGLAAV
ncbi:MAG: GAF domain-containing protein [Chloroflexales bacterium]|nr:GAF domain-containing protein [Chloroflexales bacterium]